MLKLVSRAAGALPARAFASSSRNNNKVAVILSGCGVMDGSELHEASATLVHLTRLNYQPVCYAPDKLQMHVIDHTKVSCTVQSRYVFKRIQRRAARKRYIC